MTRLVVISAPSGGGKTTLCKKLLTDVPQLVLSISSTTRKPRGSERHGTEYYFLEKSEFETKASARLFAEWALVHGNYYGTSKEIIERAFTQGKSVLLDIDVQGAASLKKAYPEHYFGLFITPPSIEILEKRLRARGTDSEETIQKRLANARSEMAQTGSFDHIIINDELERAYRELLGYVTHAIGAGENG